MTTKILIVGDCMLDVYIEGTIPRISPEANVPIFVPNDQERCQAGGAAAVARMCARLGNERAPQVTLAGVIGRDWAGKRLESELGGIVPLFEYHSCTTTKTRLVTSLGQVVRIDRDVQAWDGYGSSSEDKYSKWLDAVIDAAKFADIVLMSDYGKGTLTNDAIAAIIKANDRVIVDPARGRPWGNYNGCCGIKANDAEWYREIGMDDKEWECCSKWEIHTMGARGMALYDKKNNPLRIPANRRDVADTIGCGDQVLATLGVLLAEGMELEEACRWANAAGGLQCERRGIVPVTREELEKEMQGDESSNGSSSNGQQNEATTSVY